MLVLDPARLSAEVRWEAAAPVGETPPPEHAQPLFPHLYGTIDYGAVVRTARMQRDADGRFLSIEPGV